MQEPLLFGLDRSIPLTDAVAHQLGLPRSPHEERAFEDGEHKSRPLQAVRGRDVYVLHTLCGESGASANDKLVKLLWFVGALRDADAARVTVVAPYLCYARKDRRTKPRDPVSTRYVAKLFEAMDVDRVVTIDVHDEAAYQNAFRCVAETLEARPWFIDFVVARLAGRTPVVVSPDPGGVHRAHRFAEGLAVRLGRPVSFAFMEKRRSEGVLSGGALVGDVSGRVAVIVDDLISSGSTLIRTAIACREQDAAAVVAVATHGLFAEGSDAALRTAPFDAIAVTDSVTGHPAPAGVSVVSIVPMLSAAVHRLHTGGSLVDLREIRGPALALARGLADGRAGALAGSDVRSDAGGVA
jgi:ribose-phosphate pyrophosphokinase